MKEYSLEDELRVCRKEAREDGLVQGIDQGELLHLIKTIYKKMLKSKTNEEISDEVEEDTTIIEQIKESILEYKKMHKDDAFNASIGMEY